MAEPALTVPSDRGRITIAPEAVAQIVGRVAAECYGVVGMAVRGAARERVTQLLPKGRPARGIIVRNHGGAVALELYVVVGSRHRFATGNWDTYEQQTAFALTTDEDLSKLVLPPELDGAVYVFRRVT